MKGKLNLVFIALLLFQLVASGYMPVMQLGAATEEVQNEVQAGEDSELSEETGDLEGESAGDNVTEDENEENENVTNEEAEGDEASPEEKGNDGDTTSEADNNLVEDEEAAIQALSDDELTPTEVDNEFFDFKISEITDLQGNAYGEDNPLKPDDEFWVGIDWELKNGHSYKVGDTVTFQLPKELALASGDDGELKDSLGNVVATYVILQSGEVTLTFTGFVEENSNVTGWLEIRAELDQDQVQEEDGKVVIGPIEDEGNQVLPLDRTPINKTVEKQGQPNKSYNADEIDWTVTINKNANSLNSVVLEDFLPEGTEYVEDSLKAVKQGATLNGTPVGEKTEVSVIPSVQDGKLSIPLGDIDEVYTITYTTKVTDMEVKNFKNNVTFKDADLEDTNAEATVTINRGEPLNKGAVKNYDPKTGIIEWYLDINFNQKDLQNVTLADSWANSEAAGKMALVDGTVKFQEMTIDKNGNATRVGEPVAPSVIGATVVKEQDGFKVTGITTDRAYRVVYQTKATDRHLDGFRIENIASFNGTEKGAGYYVGQYIGVKSAGKVDYDAKTIEWEIKVNLDEVSMNDVVITDTLGAGLTLLPDSFTVTHGGAPHDFNLIDTSANPFKIDLGNISKEVIIKYKTSYDADNVPGQKPTNKANINWKNPDGTEFNKELNTNTQLNNETVNSSWKNATYNPETKEITWTIISNYRENTYDDFKIIDTPQGNQKLIEDSIRVIEMKVNADGAHVDQGPAANADISVDGNAFTINLGKTNKAYKVVYKTSVAGLEDLAKEYVNKAQVKDGNEMIADLDAKVSVYGDRKYGNKRGQQDGRRVNWSIDVNLAQEKISNLVLKDTISDNQAYIEDTIKVYNAKRNADGTVSKTDLVPSSEYVLSVNETDFTVSWKNDIERAFVVEYSTLFFAKDAENVRNDYKITGDGITEDDSDATDGYNVTIRQTSGGGADGTAGYLLVHKIDTTYGQAEQPLAGIQFDLIDTSNNKVLKAVTTDEQGFADFGRLLFGEYKLREVNTPKGYVGFDEQNIKINEEFIVGESDPVNYQLDIENYQVNGGVEIIKRDDDGNRLEGVEFTLFKADGTTVDTQTTDENGEISFEEQAPGHYYVQETKAPNGFELDETQHEIELTETQKEAIQLELTNEHKVTSVTLEKEWVDPEGTELRPDEVTVNLFRNGDYLATHTIKESDSWELTVDGLHAEDENGEPYKYSMTEQEVEGYAPSFDDSGFKVTNTRAEEREFTFTKTWYDDHNKDGDRPTEVTVELFRSVEGGDEESVDTYTLKAENDWELTTEKLPMFDANGMSYHYEVKEQAVEGYESKVDGFDITNTRVGETEITGEKFWKDDNAVDNRPESITVHLKQNGERIVQQEVRPDEEGQWLYSFDRLEKYDAQGVAYNYTIEEEHVFGYQEMYWSITPGIINIDNTRVGTTSLTGQKTWVDGDNAEETRPEAIEVQLLQNGEPHGDPTEVTADDDWAYEFGSLPAYDSEGVAYEYTIEEVEVAGYETTYDGNDIINTLVGETEVSAEKVWKGEAAEAVSVQLLANGEVIETVTISAEEDWTHVFTELPVYDAEGLKIDYTVEELAISGYSTEVTGNAEDGYTITNTRTGETDVAVTKGWLGAQGDSATVHLLANGEEVDSIELTAEKDWTHTFTALEAFDTDGQPIAYTVEEEAMDGFTPRYDGDAEKGFVITNVRSGERSVDISKTWKDEDETDRPESITVNLLANEVVVSEHEVTLEKDWTLTIDGLPKYDEVGEEIAYSITEHDVAGYESVVDGFDITNTRVDEKSIEITKAWDEVNDKYRPEAIEVELFRSIEGGDLVSVGKYDLTAENDWKLTIDELPAFDQDGKAYTYEIEEEDVAEYNSTVNGFDITNTQKTYALGDYTWIDRNKDGIQDENEEVLEGVKVELFDENGDFVAETETDENGRYIFDELPAGKYKVKFTLTEEQAKKYKFTKQNAGDDVTNDSDADENGWTTEITLDENNEQLTKEYEDQDFTASEGIDPTWDAGVFELIDIHGIKTWKDNDSTERPETITVQLFANGEEVDEIDVAGPEWNFTFVGLDKYDTNGEEITYTIAEIPVDGYVSLIDGYDITNLRTGLITVEVTKEWKGDDENSRPESITVDLLQNGVVLATVPLEKEYGWKTTFEGLDEFDQNGVPYEYTIVEHEVEGFESTVTQTEAGFTITNTFIPVKEEVPEDPEEDPADDPKDPADKDDKGDQENDLPKTATNIYNLLAIGLLLIALGLSELLVCKRRNS